MKVTAKITLSEELYVLIGVGNGRKPSSLTLMRRGTAVLIFWKIPPTSASEVEATTSLRILHFVWIGPFDGDGSCGACI